MALPFTEPQKGIQNQEDLQEFLESDTCKKIVEFVVQLSESVKGKSFNWKNETLSLSKGAQNVVNILNKVSSWVDEIAPLPNPSRFGNKAFQTFVDKVQENIDDLMFSVLSDEHQPAAKEIGVYFLNCMGDKQRLDYGSGHELNFVMFLYCLHKLGVLTPADNQALVLVVFQTYLNLMRKLQLKYWLEPAGSHGVWGLDDYHFLPFLFGASQLNGHPHIRPKSITNQEIVDAFGDKFMYLGCIKFINQVKTGSFFEHSPLLYDISGAKSWEKVKIGMEKMFTNEILGKLPIMKHFFFGSFLPLEIPERSEEHKEGECDGDHSTHQHQTQTGPRYRFQSCCVQRVPSAIAAKASEKTS